MTTPKIKTKEKLLQSAVKLALESNFQVLIRDDIVNDCDVSVGIFHYYFNSMFEMRNKLVEFAISNDINPLIGQAVAANHPLTRNLPMGKKLAAVTSLVK